jgi:hypothetical protein
MKALNTFSIACLLAVLASCSQPAAQQLSQPTPSSTPSTGSSSSSASASPSSSPTAPPSSGPSPVPSASPTPAGLSWQNGSFIRAYDFKGPAGIYYEYSANVLYVVDGIDDNVNPRRDWAREFGLGGNFLGNYHLGPKGAIDPDKVDAMAFDLRGFPFYTYYNNYEYAQIPQKGVNYWNIYELITASVVTPTNLPLHGAPRVATSALSSQGNVFTLGSVLLDYDPAITTRRLNYVRAEEDQQAEAIFSIADPLSPTNSMTVSQDGVLYLAGPASSGGLKIRSVDKSQKQAEFASLKTLPQGMWVDKDGDLYVEYDQTSAPAILDKYRPDGTLIGKVLAKLPDGSYLNHLAGLTFDHQGRRIVVGTGVDSVNHPISGIYSFMEQ